MSWSQAALDLLFNLHVRQGLSAAQTARAIGGGVTRNAVLGKAQRMGWSRPRDAPPPAGLTRDDDRRCASGRRVGPRLGRDRPLPALREVALPGTPRLWTERRRGECAYPVGEPDQPGMQLSCCAPTGGGTYCRAHKALMTEPETGLTERDIAALAEMMRRAA
jgi:GcrA cell cycle regulator